MFLKRFAHRHHLVLRKGQNLRILTTLAWNYILWLKLQLHKRLHHIKRPIVHYYAVCWNEEKMLPFMFDYYERFVDRFTIFDNGSTDKTLSIIAEHPTAQSIHFETEGTINDIVYQRIKNSCWKKSRGKADFVIVCDIDEFLYHPDIETYLTIAQKQHITIPITEGFDMYSNQFPPYKRGTLITDIVKFGVPDDGFNKSIFFDPHRIIDINFGYGAHFAKPLGIIINGIEKLKIIHCKKMGIDYLIARHQQLAKRLSETNISNGFGSHYLWNEERMRKEFEEHYKQSTRII